MLRYRNQIYFNYLLIILREKRVKFYYGDDELL